ncbi:tannase/feruloyl esterase family alpha/beta hydrolase [Roseomonas sp. OT10]|uniref:tannase/feruloyl esterase family alpha/beta hydrolase n=1 Tax=Roseomonas cutis TaxID=2897332 RepID=UPI001E4E3710|nr:tannase/feruloyl esterase family alpha/beta hydrolase [Roseomonas sp. OT10]UFN48957.1 tannase/feruloyl esterase family alpha/beta hydrolase [Roseomonas sp. OT10]
MGRAASGLGAAVVVCSLGLGGAALAQPAAQPPGVSESTGTGTFSRAQRSSVPYTLTPQQPRQGCDALRTGLSGGEVTIVSATAIPAAGDIPAYCRLRGVIAPEVQFEVNLPERWNRRFYMFGNGGYAGEDLDSPTRRDTREAALRRGFVVASNNTGHDAEREPLGTFAASTAKLVDYAFRAVHRTVEEAKRATAAYYGRPPAFSYWDACSTGGRQGLISAQRFPDDFDGILAGAPVSNFVDTMVNYIWNDRALRGSGLTIAKMGAVSQGVLARCDAADGLQDGLLADPRRCDFDPARDVKRCAPGQDGDDCLTEPQARAVAAIQGGIRLPDGSPYFHGFPPGSEAAGPALPGGSDSASGWTRWIIPLPGQPSRQFEYAMTFMQNMAFGKANPGFDPAGFDFARDPGRMAAARSLINATDPDLSAFRRRGGRLIMYHGWADTALTPLMSVEYYQKALAANGAGTPDFFRLFMVPGMFHCRGGFGPDSFDAMTALVEWVEAGTAPDSIPAAQLAGSRIARTRPLCPYPQLAVHDGRGSPDEAASFACRAPSP